MNDLGALQASSEVTSEAIFEFYGLRIPYDPKSVDGNQTNQDKAPLYENGSSVGLKTPNDYAGVIPPSLHIRVPVS